MSLETFETLSMYVFISGLILLMAYIVWDLAKRSNAGKFGTVMMFFVLGFGVLGFVIKTLMVEALKL